MILHRKRIYIVEDSLQNRLIYQVILLKHGAELYFDKTGDETVTRLGWTPHKPHLIILDLMLGTDGDGFDIARRIRALPGYATLPILIVSASEPMAAMAKARMMGLSGFVAKPIDSILFPDQVLRVMSGESIWSAGDRYITTG